MDKNGIQVISFDVIPINFALHRAGLVKNNFQKTKIDKILRMNVIERKQSEWPAPIVYVSRKDESLHFCIAYRNLNAMNFEDEYPIL